jgi:hypothetical protein
MVEEIDFSKVRVIGWYSEFGAHIEQWAIDEGLVVNYCEECEREMK